jgi:hypothetical protein
VAWRRGDYSIEADELLEDLAGNTPVRVFDEEMSERGPATRPVAVRFRVGS